MLPGAFIAALDWLYGTRRQWQRLRRGSLVRHGYLAIAMRLAERQRGKRGTYKRA